MYMLGALCTSTTLDRRLNWSKVIYMFKVIPLCYEVIDMLFLGVARTLVVKGIQWGASAWSHLHLRNEAKESSEGQAPESSSSCRGNITSRGSCSKRSQQDISQVFFISNIMLDQIKFNIHHQVVQRHSSYFKFHSTFKSKRDLLLQVMKEHHHLLLLYMKKHQRRSASTLQEKEHHKVSQMSYKIIHILLTMNKARSTRYISSVPHQKQSHQRHHKMI